MRTATLLGVFTAVTLASGALAQPMPVGVYFIEPSPTATSVGNIKLSRNGQVVAGNDTATGAFRWTLAGGRDNLDGGDAPEFSSVVTLQALSPDGSTTLHIAPPVGEPNAAFAYRPGSGVQQFGPVSGIGRTERVFASNNASTVYATRFTNPQQFGIIRVPYRWTQATGWQDVTPTPFVGSDWVETIDVSDDGGTWLGLNNGFTGTPGYFIANASGATMLTSAGEGFGNARALSGDGSYAVGSWINQGVSTFPVLWGPGTAQQLPTPLGFEGGFATDVSNGGTTVVGLMGRGSSLNTAFVWTSTGGMKTLADFLDDFGLALPVGVQVREIQISGDGTVLAGSWNPQPSLGLQGRGFVAVIPAPSSILVLSGTIALAARRRR